MPRTKKGREEEANFPRPFAESNHKRNEAVSIIGKVDTIAKVKVRLFRLGNKKGHRDDSQLHKRKAVAAAGSSNNQRR